MKNKGFAQLLLIIIAAVAVAVAVAFYLYQSRVSKPIAIPQPTATVETVDQSIAALDNNFTELTALQDDIDLKDLVDLEQELNEANFSSI